ncbi:hypothetical protein MHTCC0001_31650 [Flavobacteriaceae bacterium MHTCC 0001]
MNDIKQEEDLNEIYKLIFSEDFGEPKITKNFLKSIRQLNAKQRVTSILSHYLELESTRKQYETAYQLLKLHDRFFYNSEDEDISSDSKPLYNPNDPLTNLKYSEIINLVHDCSYFQLFLDGDLPEQLSRALRHIYISFSLHDYEENIKKSQPILTHDVDLLEISPLLFPLRLWQEIIIHDLSTTINYGKFELMKNKIAGQIEELRYHIGGEVIPNNLNRFFEYHDFGDGIFYDFRIQFNDFSAKNFTNSIEDYLAFVYDLNEANITKASTENLIIEFKKEEARRAKLQIKNRKVKLINPQKVNRAINGFAYLIKKSNPDIDYDLAKNIASETIYSLFDNKLASEHVQRAKINFSNVVLIDYIIFLAKNKCLKLHNNITLYPKLISERLPFRVKGCGEKRLYQLLKKKLHNNLVIIEKDKEDYSRLNLNFDGLTSERVLKNEMKN